MAQFNFDAGKRAATAAGFGWSDEVAADVDKEFAALDLQQWQVDRLLVLYVHYMGWAVDPKRLTLRQRLAAAAFFMKG